MGNYNPKFEHKLEQYSLLEKAYQNGYLSDRDFSLLLQNFLISPGGYVMDTGSNENANSAVVLRLFDRIKEHPLLWKWFFMVA